MFSIVRQRIFSHCSASGASFELGAHLQEMQDADNDRRLKVAISNPVPADESALWRAMGLFLVPQTADIALQLISSTITAVFFGRLLGAPALAVVATFFPIFLLLTSFLLGLFNG